MASAAWTPGPGIADHLGLPIAADDDFFVPPPPEIGAVRSASTTLKCWMEPTAASSHRVRVTLVTGAVAFALVCLLSLADWKPDQTVVFRQIAAALLCVSLLVAWLAAKPGYVCSYVGERGVARFACYGSRERVTLREVFRFETAASLVVSLRNIHVNGGYLNTEYSFRWLDGCGNQRYRLAGVHRGGARSSASAPLFVAREAEASWTQYLLPNVLSSFDGGQACLFQASRGGSVGVAPEYLEFRGRRLRYEDLDLCVERGYIEFRRKGERRAWYRLDRTLRVRCAYVHNALLMLCLVSHRTGRGIANPRTATDARYHLLPVLPH